MQITEGELLREVEREEERFAGVRVWHRRLSAVIQKYEQSSYVLILAKLWSPVRLISWVSLGYHNQHSALAIMVRLDFIYSHQGSTNACNIPSPLR